MLASVADRLTLRGQHVTAIQVYQRAAALGGDLDNWGFSELIDWKMGTAYWRLAEQVDSPRHAAAARALWGSAAINPLPDPRSARMAAPGRR